MSYIDDNLMAGERVEYRGKLHWIIFTWAAIWLILALMFFGSEVFGAGVILLLIVIVMGIASYINLSSSEFGITNKRVIAKVGFVRRSSIEVLLSKVEGVQVDQSLLGRMMGYGSIVVSGTGGMREPFHKIADPLEFRKKAQEQIEKAQTTS